MIRQRVYASLPWYDLPEAQPATDAFWRALADAFERRGVVETPLSLDRDRPHGVDDDASCLFTQTCGYLLFTTAREHFTVVGAPCYRVPGCAGPLHRSFIVVRRTSPVNELEALRGGRFAINEPGSNSGMNLPRLLFAPLARDGRFFASTVVTGGHAASAELVAAGGADAAAIDCVTFALLARYRPLAVAGLRIIAETAPTPAPPLVTARFAAPELVATLRAALREVVANDALAPVRDALFLAGIDYCDESAYDVLMDYERDAARLGYPALR